MCVCVCVRERERGGVAYEGAFDLGLETHKEWIEISFQGFYSFEVEIFILTAIA